MVHEMQQRIYLPDFTTDEEKDGRDSVLESRHSTSSVIGDIVSEDNIENIASSSSLRSQSSVNHDKDISWRKLKRSK